MQLLNITEICREIILIVMGRCVCECHYPLVVFLFQLNTNLILFSLKP